MQLKTVSNADILIDQVHKFKNSYFQEHLWKAATVLQKAYCLEHGHYKASSEICLWCIFQKTLPLTLPETLNGSIFVSSFLNFVQLDVLHFSYYTGLCTGR